MPFDSVEDMVREQYPDAKHIEIQTLVAVHVRRPIAIVDGREFLVADHYHCNQCGVVPGKMRADEVQENGQIYIESYCRECEGLLESRRKMPDFGR